MLVSYLNLFLIFSLFLYQQNSMGKISFTMDLWTDDLHKRGYMAVTAHWLEKATLQRPQPKICLRTDLIGFLHVPGSHTGERLAEAFLFVLEHLKIAKKVNKYYFGKIRAYIVL
jgi:hypothetical protein